MTQIPNIVWFRRDLRISDNPALTAAAKSGAPIIALYIDETDIGLPLGAASKVWLHHSLNALEADMGSLIIRRGIAREVVEQLVSETGAKGVFWNRRYQKADCERDANIKASLKYASVEAQSFNANLLSEPWEVKTKTRDSYYKVFTPYWRAARSMMSVADPLPKPKINRHDVQIESLSVDDLELLPGSPDWASKMLTDWSIGEKGAQEALNEFLAGAIQTYKSDRDRPDKPNGTSRLSPHLAFGEISPRQIWHAVKKHEFDGEKFLSEVGWREFSYSLLYYNPELASENFRCDFDGFPWVKNDAALTAWQKGQTGYPFVDAGMRQLWKTGYQHNRVRMVAASFLIKHLLIDWREGERWYWDTLFDADPANNAASWQLVAGSGADAAPYFRIFNPFGQGKKFDPNGDYVRRWIPEIARLPNKFIHKPWEAPQHILDSAGVKLGEAYPKPIIDHRKARERALEAYQSIRS